MNSVAAAFRRWTTARHFHSSALAAYPRRPRGDLPPPQYAETGLFTDEDEDLEEFIPYEEREGHGSSSAGHMLLRQQRHMLQYMRLIEHDMPNLVQWREPFDHPPSDRPLVVRTISYGGEEHPATAKRIVVVPVARLPLEDASARHTLKLLAGPRWFPDPPLDSGIGPAEGEGEDGYIKISCENFPQPGMNLKWISDVIDRLVAEANANRKKYKAIPLDMRHVVAKNMKAKKDGQNARASLRDFPLDWLPLH